MAGIIRARAMSAISLFVRLTRAMKRRLAQAIGGVDVGLVCEQELHGVLVGVVCRVMERSFTQAIPGVDVGLVREQEFRNFLVGALCLGTERGRVRTIPGDDAGSRSRAGALQLRRS